MKTKIKNPYSKYSYNTGLVTNNNKPIYGVDIKWLMFEIKQGRLPKLKDATSWQEKENRIWNILLN